MISYLSEFPHTHIALLFPPENPSDTDTFLTESLILNLSLYRHVLSGPIRLVLLPRMNDQFNTCVPVLFFG